VLVSVFVVNPVALVEVVMIVLEPSVVVVLGKVEAATPVNVSVVEMPVCVVTLVCVAVV
jgi:hypothetical protein